AIVKVKLRKKSDEDYKKQQEALKDDKQARLFLKVTCQGDDRKHKKVFVKPIEEDQYIHPIAFGEHFKLICGDPYTFYITRESEVWTGANSSSMTLGTFRFGDITGYICEPYGEETTLSGKDKRIPVGTYSLKWHFSEDYPKNNYTLETDFGKKWDLKFPSLKNGVVCVYNDKVPKSRGILIHAGQDGGWTKGCILPGKTLNKDLKKRNMKLKESVQILHKILNKIDEVGIENVKLIIQDEID
ncbi:MAG: DUF5675 family protein, partial [Bacteroidota bacterium]